MKPAAMHETGLHETGLHETGLHETGLHETGLHETGLHETTLHGTTLHETALHETLRTALATIRELRAANQRLEAGLAGGTEPIAIVAASYRLPGGADSPERFWEVLTGSHDVVRPLPVHRWAHLDFSAFGAAGAGEGWAGSIDDVAGFDAEFFGNRTARRS